MEMIVVVVALMEVFYCFSRVYNATVLHQPANAEIINRL